MKNIYKLISFSENCKYNRSKIHVVKLGNSIVKMYSVIINDSKPYDEISPDA